MRTIRRKIHFVIVLSVAAAAIGATMLFKGRPATEKRSILYNVALINIFYVKINVGQKLYNTNCKMCHPLFANVDGVDVKTARTRMPDTLIAHFLLYPQQTILQNNYLRALYQSYGETPHPAFANILDQADIDDIIMYIDFSSKQKQ